jgi:hypothetical protein
MFVKESKTQLFHKLSNTHLHFIPLTVEVKSVAATASLKMKSWMTHNSKKLCFIISHLKEGSSPCTKPALIIPPGNDCQQGITPLSLGSTLSSQGAHRAFGHYPTLNL